MNFLKNLFGGGAPRDDGYYVYVQPKMCQEILKVRVNMMNELSKTDNGKGYFVRKLASGTRCPFQAEIMLYFDDRRRLLNREIENGEFVTEADYVAKYGDTETA